MTSNGDPAPSPAGGVHVVLVNYRTAGHIAERLASRALVGQDVVVVDNGSEPDAIAAVCREHGARPILLPVNVGFAAGVNAAVRSLDQDGAPVLLLNPDAEVTAKDVRDLVASLEHLGADAVAPLLLDSDGRVQVGAAGGPVTAASVAWYFLFLSHFVPARAGVFLTRRQLERSQQVAWLCMACALVRRDAFDRFGPVPEDELVYAEDVAWGTAATARGARLWLEPAIRVRHAQGVSGGSMAWSGALERLIGRRMSARRAHVAIASMRTGLALRRLVGPVRRALRRLSARRRS